jgi:hypothetical protein
VVLSALAASSLTPSGRADECRIAVLFATAVWMTLKGIERMSTMASSAASAP